MLFYET